jgi:hypothetical protein
MFWLAFWVGLPFALLLGFLLLSRLLSGGHRFLTRLFENPAYEEVRCPSCTYGTQYLHPEKGRIPIPRHLRMITRGQYAMGSPQANVVKCNDCGGNGWTSTRRKDAIDTGYKELNP